MNRAATESDAPICFRATPQDRELLAELREKLGLTNSGVLKVGIRRLHEVEGGRRKPKP